MTCFVCQSEMTETTVTYFEEVEECFIIIKHVPCWKCEECGEVHYSLGTLERIEKIIDELKQKLMEVNIVEYNNAA